ncbi:MAG TPA: zinc-binding alcohol dehydrogenase, partial [Nitrospirota bacterium]|nr:zinc-binding alcohol dehydrogenase [Nitrospirota bacterium]
MEPVEEIKLSGPADAAIVFAPSSTVRQAISAIKSGGIVVLGAFAEIGPLPFVEEKAVVGSLLGWRKQMLDVFQRAAASKI